VLPAPAELAGRLGVLTHVLYLVFNEGYTASSGPGLRWADLTVEAVRLTRLCTGCCPARVRSPGCSR
jgi:predicted RNA polymerase sigma factor